MSELNQAEVIELSPLAHRVAEAIIEALGQSGIYRPALIIRIQAICGRLLVGD